MTYLVELSERARRDLEMLYFEKNVAESVSANAWFNGLEAAIEDLCHLPIRCPIAPETKSSSRTLRHLLYGKKPHVYRVIYEVNESQKLIKIYHIRHGAMQSAEISGQ